MQLIELFSIKLYESMKLPRRRLCGVLFLELPGKGPPHKLLSLVRSSCLANEVECEKTTSIISWKLKDARRLEIPNEELIYKEAILILYRIEFSRKKTN